MIPDLEIAPSDYTPAIRFQASGHLSLSGKSYPENTFEFYAPVLEWVRSYFEQGAAERTVVEIELIYFNSSSSRLLFDLFDLLDEHREQYAIEVRWIYDAENESAREAGEDFVEDFEDLNILLQVK